MFTRQMEFMLRVERAKTAALGGKLLRLAATDVPGTPRLMMKQRSPSELAGIEHGYNQFLTNNLHDPAKKAVEPLLQKLPEGKAQHYLRKGVHTLIENPEGIVAWGTGIPGALEGYVGGKKLLEKGIDRFAPAAVPASGFMKNAEAETPVVRAILEELEKIAANAQPGDVNIGQWWEQKGGPHLAKGGDHAEFKKMMDQDGIPDGVQKQFMRMAQEKYPPGYNRGRAARQSYQPPSDPNEPPNPGYQGRGSGRGSSYGESTWLNSNFGTRSGKIQGALGVAAPSAVLLHSMLGKKKEEEVQDPSRLRAQVGSHISNTLPFGLAGAMGGHMVGPLLGFHGGASALVGGGLGALLGAGVARDQVKGTEEDASRKARGILRRGDPENVEKGKAKAEDAALDTVAGSISKGNLLGRIPSLLLGAHAGPSFLALSGLSSAASTEGNALVEQYRKRLLHQKLQEQQPVEKAAAGAPTRGGFMMASDVPPMRVPSLRAPVEKTSDALPDYVTYNPGDFKKAKLSEGAGDGMSMDSQTAAENQQPEDFKKKAGAMEVIERVFMERLKKADVSPSVSWSPGTGGAARQASFIPPMKMQSLAAPIAKVAGLGSIVPPPPPPASPFKAAQTAKTIGAPKVTPAGPSIAQIAKPKGKGFGTGIAGAFKPQSGIGGSAPVKLDTKLGPN